MSETVGPTFIANGVVCYHPRNDIGVFINQIVPVRRASLLERFLWLFGVSPAP